MNYDFAERLIELRRQHDLSQEDLAKDLGVSRQAISKWERAESTPDVTNLVALANLYKISLDELVHGESPAKHEANEPAEDTVTDSTPTETSNEDTGTTTPPPPSGAPYATTPPPPPEDATPVQPTTAPAPQQPKKHDPLYTFPYPVLIIMIYLFLGFCFGLWHPGWVLFFTIPFYYWIVSVITNDPNYAARRRNSNR